MAINSASTSCSIVLSTGSALNSIFNSAHEKENLITTTYIGKDVIGQFGGLLCAMKLGKKVNNNTVKYALVGTILQQVAIYLEYFSVFIKNDNFILPFLGVTSAIKNISFITTGAVNATNLQELTKKEEINMGELYSKVAGINTLSSTFGMLIGMGLIHVVPSFTIRTYIVLPTLSLLSLWSISSATKIAQRKL